MKAVVNANSRHRHRGKGERDDGGHAKILYPYEFSLFVIHILDRFGCKTEIQDARSSKIQGKATVLA